MHAIGLMTHGGPQVLQEVDVPAELLRPGTIAMMVHAAAVNPTDVMARNGARAQQQSEDEPPYIPGMDVAGTVDAIAADVQTGLSVGDRVMAMVVPNSTHGAYRSQIVLNARSVVRMPDDVSFAEASTLPMNGLTARLSLDLLALPSGQTLAVTGAAGTYGSYVIQLAKSAGLTVIADASAADVELVRSFGADLVLARGDDFAARVREHYPEGVDGLADGAVLNERAMAAVRDGGVMTSVRGFDGAGDARISLKPTWVRSYDGEWEKLDQLRQLANSGVLSLRVAQVYPAEQASVAHARLEAGGTRGRLVLEF